MLIAYLYVAFARLAILVPGLAPFVSLLLAKASPRLILKISKGRLALAGAMRKLQVQITGLSAPALPVEVLAQLMVVCSMLYLPAVMVDLT